MSTARRGARLLKRTAEAGTARSRLGGLPDLRDASAWPTRPPLGEMAEHFHRLAKSPDKAWPQATPAQAEQLREDNRKLAEYCDSHAPLPFIGQFDFAELNPDGAIADFPSSGLLSLFYDAAAMPWDDHPSASAVVWEPAAEKLQTVPSAPEALAGLPNGSFPAMPLKAELGLFLPDGEDQDLAALGLPEDVEIEYSEWQSDAHHEAFPVDHRLGGRVDTIQNDMQYVHPETGARNVPLLQIDSDSRLEMLWGDCGRLYLWIHPDDLKNQRFDRARLYMQCS